MFHKIEGGQQDMVRQIPPGKQATSLVGDDLRLVCMVSMRMQ